MNLNLISILIVLYSFGYYKTGNKNVQLVLQHRCKTSWKTMLPVLTPTFKPIKTICSVSAISLPYAIACEQALLFGRVKRISRELASERRSREGPPRSRGLARFTSLAQIGELARRVYAKALSTVAWRPRAIINALNWRETGNLTRPPSLKRC